MAGLETVGDEATTTAETADRKKNDEPTSCPKSRGESFSSSMIGLAASPTTILSAKFISMKRKSVLKK